MRKDVDPGKPWDDIPATRINLREELDEKPAAFAAENLQGAINTGCELAKPQIEKLFGKDYTPVVIVALHGDLANALKMREPRFATYDEKKAGTFFDRKPVLAILKYTPGQRLSEIVFRDPPKEAGLFPNDKAKSDPLS